MGNARYEQSYYYERCKIAYPDNMKTILSINTYTNAQQYMAMAEVAYFLDNRILPEWSIIIERVETHGDNDLFIHNDISKAN